MITTVSIITVKARFSFVVAAFFFLNYQLDTD